MLLWHTCTLNASLIIVCRKSPCCALPQTIYFIVKETLNCMVPSHLVQITKYQHIHVRCANISICVRLKMQLELTKNRAPLADKALPSSTYSPGVYMAYGGIYWLSLPFPCFTVTAMLGRISCHSLSLCRGFVRATNMWFQ